MELTIRLCFISLLCLFNLRGYKAGGEINLNQRDGAHNHMNSDGLTFFTPKDLKLGKVMPDQPLITNPVTSPKFLPKEDAQLIPFSLSQLPSLVKLFGFQKDSSEAMAMEESLTRCEMSPLEGESQFCATSLESLLDSVNQTLQSRTGFKALSTRLIIIGNQDRLNRYYTIVDEPRRITTPKAISCHLMSYPYGVYYCHLFHEAETMVKVFQISLRGENGGLIDAASICHMNTSLWNPDHSSFRDFGMKRGSPVCHFFPSDDLVWVALTRSHLDSKPSIGNV